MGPKSAGLGTSRRQWSWMEPSPYTPSLLDQWMDRPHGQVSFRLTKLLMGHSCFNRYLYRIGSVSSSGCSHCGPPKSSSDEEDSTYHTLVRCRAFESDREALVKRIDDLNPSDLVPHMLESSAMWDAIVRFAESVMSVKEVVERARQREVRVVSSRRRPAGDAARGRH